MPYRTDDPVADFDRWDCEQERSRERHYLCKCAQCGEVVYDYDDYYEIELDRIHDDCILDWIAQFKK